MDKDIIFLEHIVEAIDKIESYLNGKEFDSFRGDDMVVDASVRELEIIGEAANNVSDEFRNSNPKILWNKMISMRNVLIHEYFGVNKKTVWDTCKNDLPKLKEMIGEVLKK